MGKGRRRHCQGHPVQFFPGWIGLPTEGAGADRVGGVTLRRRLSRTDQVWRFVRRHVVRVLHPCFGWQAIDRTKAHPETTQSGVRKFSFALAGGNQHGRCYKSQRSNGTNPERARKAIATSQAAADMPVVTCRCGATRTSRAKRGGAVARLKMNSVPDPNSPPWQEELALHGRCRCRGTGSHPLHRH